MALYPALDDRPYPIAKFKMAIEEKGIDVIPDFTYQLFSPNPDPCKQDKALAPSLQPYFLKGSIASRYALGNQICTPLATNIQSGGKFTICVIEGGKLSGSTSLEEVVFTFAKTDFLLRVAEGIVDVTLNAEHRERLSSGESLFIPRDTPFSYRFPGKYACFYIFGGQNEGGLERIFQEAGKGFDGVLESHTPFEWEKVEEAARRIGAVVKRK